MIGAIIGDIVGSIYEFDNIKTKDFEFLTEDNFFTDDTVMSLAIAKAIMVGGDPETAAATWMRKLGKVHPYRGYGGRFNQWLLDRTMGPYNSWGNGSAMRISAVGFASNTLEEVKDLSAKVTRVTHNHPEGMKGAEAAAVSIFHLGNGMSREELRALIEKEYYNLDFTIDGIRPTYEFGEDCQRTLPVAIEAFLEADGYEDAIRNAISIGGDSDTIACITGGLAEAYFGVPEEIEKKGREYLTDDLLDILDAFEKKYQGK